MTESWVMVAGTLLAIASALWWAPSLYRLAQILSGRLSISDLRRDGREDRP